MKRQLRARSVGNSSNTTQGDERDNPCEVRSKACTFAAAVSLAVCVAAVAAWAWGGSLTLRDVRDWGLWCERGSFCFKTLRYIGEEPVTGPLLTILWNEWDTHWQCAGFEYGRGEFIQVRHRYATTEVRVPLWFVALLAAPLPAWRGRNLARKRTVSRRASRGLCVQCGYDVRATPARCPECGARRPNTPN